jgi:hypothetical protein
LKKRAEVEWGSRLLPVLQIDAYEMIVHIWEVNDPPVISDPQKCFFRAGCYGDIRTVRIKATGKNYYTTKTNSEGQPFKIAPTLEAVCLTSKCQECVTEKFTATLDIDAGGTIIAVHVVKPGRGYVMEFAPTLSILGGGAGSGAVIVGDIGASLFSPCPFPQSQRDVNGFPQQANDFENCDPEPECSAGSAFPLPKTDSLLPLEYYFGQFWRYEDRSEPLAIAGLIISDLDISESCSYLNPYCNSLDVSVKAFQGTILLNHRQTIDLYQKLPNFLAWSSTEPSANLALKVVLYQTELQAFMGPASKALNYNSQVDGGRPEFVTVSANDQGFTGFDGIGACHKGDDWAGMGYGAELSCGLRLNVTVVAVNDAPVILTPAGTVFKATENKPFQLTELDVKDVDLLEPSTSMLAIDDWTGVRHFQRHLNKIRIRMEVTKGNIHLSPSVRDLRVTGNSTQMWWIVSRNIYGHDLCRARKCVSNPASCLEGYNSGSAEQKESLTYQDVCSFKETTPELLPFALSSCTDRAKCTCQIDESACARYSSIYLL